MLIELLNTVEISWLNIILTLVLLILSWTAVLNYSGRQPPGPFQLPFVGSYFALNNHEAIGRQFSKMGRKYGDPFTFRFGSLSMVIVNSWPVIQEAIKSSLFDDKYPTETAKLLASGGNGISFHNGIEWLKMRKIAIAVVRKYSDSEDLPVNVEWAVNNSLAAFPSDNTYFNPMEILSVIETNLAFCNVIGRCDDVLEDAHYQQLWKNAIKTREFFSDSMWIDYFPVLRFLLRKSVTKFEHDVYRNTLSIMNEKLQEHRSTYLEGAIRDFCDGFISYQLEAESNDPELAEYLNDPSICQTLWELFQASSDTSAMGLIYTVRILAQFPDVQKRVWDEINNEIGSERLPAQSDKSNCPYTLAVIYEALRISMVATSGFHRRAARDTHLGGYEVTQGTAVFLNYVGVSENDANWPEPNTFRPDRFLNPDGSFVSSVPSTFLPFGLGRRSCFGEKVAILHLFITLVILVRHFEFFPETGQLSSSGLSGKLAFETLPIMVLGVPTAFNIAVRRR